MKRIDDTTFKKVKKWLYIRQPKAVANKFDLHESTVLNIRGCKNFREYREMVEAEHPPTKYSLGEDVIWLHRKLLQTKDYIAPDTAHNAMVEIKEWVNQL